MTQLPSRLGSDLLQFLVFRPDLTDPLTAYNTWARQGTGDYGCQKAQKALFALRYLNSYFQLAPDELQAAADLDRTGHNTN